jgi:hypothetical protein
VDISVISFGKRWKTQQTLPNVTPQPARYGFSNRFKRLESVSG